MTWIEKCLLEPDQRTTSQPNAMSQPPDHPHWKAVWGRFGDVVTSNIAEFNAAQKSTYDVSINGRLIYVIPKQPPMNNAVFQIDSTTEIIQVDFPIDHEGVPRRGTFKVRDGRIISQGDFVGAQPPTDPMTLEKFSEFLLKPLLFPHLN
jgi:hypothetical protein